MNWHAVRSIYFFEMARTRRTLLQQERAIARKYTSDPKEMWPYTVITLGCFALWLAFWPLAMMDVLPLWVGFIASITMIVAALLCGLAILAAFAVQVTLLAR
mgnify:CR=1 FL=1